MSDDYNDLTPGDDVIVVERCLARIRAALKLDDAEDFLEAQVVLTDEFEGHCATDQNYQVPQFPDPTWVLWERYGLLRQAPEALKRILARNEASLKSVTQPFPLAVVNLA